MIDTLNSLVDLITEALKGIGINDLDRQSISSILAILFILLIAIKYIFSAIKYFTEKRRKKTLAKDLHPFYSYKEIDNATKYYVSTRFQNVPPSEDEEPRKSYMEAAKKPLIPLFIKKVFKNDNNDSKYYLVLADSGMGKTTFLINLYLKYKYKKVWFWQNRKYNIRLFPLGHPSTLQRLEDMTVHEKENTILLLDAFDEDNEAGLNHEKRLKQILDLVWEFREIVITCRTQFFPSSKNEPTETGWFKFGPDSGQFTFQKIYISVFSENDIKNYLKKRYRLLLFFKRHNYLKAMGIALKSPNLMIRPMLLSHIEDLVSVNKSISFGFQIYETLIDQWLERESNKANITKKYGTSYKSLLFEFSKALARDLYLNRQNRGNKLSLKVDELIDNPNGLQLSDYEGSNLEIDYADQRFRSLLNRNAVGEYKFSHKSIFEYLIAKEAIENSSFRQTFRFNSELDTAKEFFIEMIRYKNIEIGQFLKDNDLGFQKNELEDLIDKQVKIKSDKSIFLTLFKTSVVESIKIVILVLILVFVLPISIFSYYAHELMVDKYGVENVQTTIFTYLIILVNIVIIIHTLILIRRKYKRIKSELMDDKE